MTTTIRPTSTTLISPTNAHSKQSSIVTNFLLYSTASSIANCVTHPLETIKTFQQLPHQKTQISTFNAAKTIITNGGISALYKGIHPSLLRACISGGGRLALFSSFKDIAYQFNVLTPGEIKSSETVQRGLMAITAGCLAAFISSPVDMLRTRQAGYTGSFASTPSMYSIAHKVGIQGLFSGSSALLGRAASFNLAQLLTYDVCKHQAMNTFNIDGRHIGGHFVAALSAGLIATTVSTPFENIKTDMQIVDRNGGITAVTRRMFRKGGIQIFYRGFVPLYWRCGSHTLVVFVVAEKIREICGLTPM